MAESPPGDREDSELFQANRASRESWSDEQMDSADAQAEPAETKTEVRSPMAAMQLTTGERTMPQPAATCAIVGSYYPYPRPARHCVLG